MWSTGRGERRYAFTLFSVVKLTYIGVATYTVLRHDEQNGCWTVLSFECCQVMRLPFPPLVLVGWLHGHAVSWTGKQTQLRNNWLGKPTFKNMDRSGKPVHKSCAWKIEVSSWGRSSRNQSNSHL